MNTNLNLLRSVIARIEKDQTSMAFFLKTYREIADESESDVVSIHKYSTENIYKLALCIAPDVNAHDYVQRVSNISDYTNIMTEDINTIIKEVNFWLKFSKATESEVAIAARDKKKKKDDPKQ